MYAEADFRLLVVVYRGIQLWSVDTYICTICCLMKILPANQIETKHQISESIALIHSQLQGVASVHVNDLKIRNMRIYKVNLDLPSRVGGYISGKFAK